MEQTSSKQNNNPIFSDKLFKKNIDCAPSSKSPNSSSLDQAHSSNSTSSNSPLADTQDQLTNSTFMVGSSRGSSVSENSESNSGLSSWQTTTTNTAASSIDVYAFRQNTDLSSNSKLQQSQRYKPNLLNKNRNLQVKEHFFQKNIELSKDLPTPEDSEKEACSTAPPAQNNLVAGSTASASITNLSQHKHAQIFSKEKKILETNSLQNNTTSNKIPLNPKLDKSAVQKLELNSALNGISNYCNNHLQSSTHLNSGKKFVYSSNIVDSNSTNISDNLLKSSKLPDSKSYYISSTHKNAQLERQLVQQQDFIDNTQVQLASINNHINYLTGANSAYVASTAASLLLDSHPSHKDILDLPNSLYTWTRIVDRPFESSIARSIFLSKSHHANNQKKFFANLERENDKSLYNSQKTKKPDLSDSKVNDDSWWDSLMPPTFDSNSEPLENKKHSKFKDSLENMPWFKPISRIDKQLYHTNKRKVIISNESALKLSDKNSSQHYSNNNQKHYKTNNNMLLPSSNTKAIIDQVKSYIKDISKSYGTQSDKFVSINHSTNLNVSQQNQEKKKVLSTIEITFDNRLYPNYLEILNSSKAELRLASRTAVTAARVKIAPPPRLVTNSVATLETWKGRRVPGLLKLNMYTGSTNLPASLQSTNSILRNENIANSKNIDKLADNPHIDQTSIKFRKSKQLASKGIPLCFFYFNERDYVTMQKSILEYYQRIPSTQSGLAPKFISKNSSLTYSYNNNRSNSLKKKLYFDTAMSPLKLIAIPQIYLEQFEYALTRQYNANATMSRKNKANNIYNPSISDLPNTTKDNSNSQEHITTQPFTDFNPVDYIKGSRFNNNKNQPELLVRSKTDLFEGSLAYKKNNLAFSNSIVDTRHLLKKQNGLFRSKNAISSELLNRKNWKQTSKPTLEITNISVEQTKSPSKSIN
ncbi:hypothetical protein BB561_004309 [Smittium simulii]|uniref:Uncharacterized protein n=1 Tax=Smittium simulii TaxID=133385 RepID=A0A2T9YH06_9FUNG|nr:hypothetical protein BB561_004309 [Smittium simulii]